MKGGVFMAKYKALDIARYIINYTIEKDNPISNLQLQKIIYYVQAAFLIETGDVAFDEKILNWSYGPVVEEVYREYRTYGYLPISNKQEKYTNVFYDSNDGKVKIRYKTFKESQFMESHKKIINKIIDTYMYTDAFDLVEKTHQEDPWRKSNQNDVIPPESIKEYYKKHNNKLYDKKL